MLAICSQDSLACKFHCINRAYTTGDRRSQGGLVNTANPCFSLLQELMLRLLKRSLRHYPATLYPFFSSMFHSLTPVELTRRGTNVEELLTRQAATRLKHFNIHPRYQANTYNVVGGTRRGLPAGVIDVFLPVPLSPRARS